MPEELFVGRARELEVYTKFLARETPWVFIITGLGGIGKTTLLRRLAEYTLSESPLFKTGVVTLDFANEDLRNDPLKLLDKLTTDTAPYCDLEQIDGDFKEVLQQNIDQLAQLSLEKSQTGVSESEDPALREIRHQLRELATEAFYTQIKTFRLNQLVMMLDTCEWLNEPEGIEVGQWVLDELLSGLHTRIRQQGRQCHVVMASRVQLKLDVINGRDQQRIALSMLGKAEVDQYLEHMGMQDAELRKRVFDVTYGHALCVSIIGDFWQQREAQKEPFTIADLPELQLQEFSEIALMQFTNERVLKQLKSPFNELTRYGVLLRSFDLPLLRNVFPELLPEAEALEIFNQLIRYPYIESRGNYRYAFHELLRQALPEVTQKEEPEEWKCYHKRALDYLTEVAFHSPDWYYHLLACDEKQGLVEWQLAIQEARESGKHEFSGALLQAALDTALNLSPTAHAEIAYEEGRFNFYGFQWEKALKSYNEALASFKQVEDFQGQAKVLQAMGDVQRALAKQDDALESYVQALAFFRQKADQLGEAKCSQAVGDVQRLLNEPVSALLSYQHALDLFRRIANQPEEAKVLEVMGDVQRLRNQPDTALRSYEQALALYQEEKDRLKRAKVLKAIGDVQGLLQNKNAALESYGQALAIFGELKEPTEEANVRRAMAEFTFISLPSDEHRRLARALFLRLIDPGVTEQATTRSRVALAELSLPDPQQTTIIRETADAFIAARLLSTNEIAGTPTIEVSHEDLIREWTRLAEWLRQAREDITLQQAVSTDAAEWIRRGKPTGRLYRGTQLAAALALRERSSLSLDEEAFLEAGVSEQARHETFIAERQQQEALQRKRYTRRTVLVGLAGLGLAVTAAAASSLLILRNERSPSLQPSLPLPYSYLGHTDAVDSVAWSPDGTRLASASNDHTVRVWDATSSGKTALTYGGHTDAVYSVAWSPDGTRLASASADKTVQVWDASSGQTLFTYKRHRDIVFNVAWSPDGKRLASASYDQTVQVWDASSGQTLLTYKGHRDVVYSVAWSPDGTRLASASNDQTVQVWLWRKR